MEKETKKNTASQEKLATDAQIKLIKALYEETSCKRCYDDEDLAILSREGANKHINFLKETKVRDAQLRSHYPQNNGFDKIAFGLTYKLVWRASQEQKMAVQPTAQHFIDVVIEEYKLFKDAQKQCRAEVEEGGQ